MRYFLSRNRNKQRAQQAPTPKNEEQARDWRSQEIRAIAADIVANEKREAARGK